MTIKRAEKNALLVHRKTQRSSTERSIKRLLEQHIQQEEHFHKLFESELNSLELKKTRAPQSQLSHKHGSEKHVDAKEPLPKSIFEDVPNDQEVGGGEFRGAHYSEEHGNGTTAPNLREEPSINAHMDQRLTVNRAGYALFDGKTRPAFSPLLPVDCKPTSGPQLMASAPNCRGGPSAFRYKLHDLADKLYRTESSLSPRRVLRKCSRVDDEFGQAHDDSDDFSARAVNDPNKSESSLYISNGLRKIPGCWQIPCVYPQSTSEPRCSDGDHGSTSVGRLENAAEALLSAASALLGSRVTGTNISTAVNESIQGKPKFGRASLEDDTFEIDPVSKTNPDSRFQTRRSHPLVSEIDPGVHNACAKTLGFKVSKSSPDIFSEDISGDDVLALPTSCPVSTCTVPRLKMKKLSFVAESPDLATGSADHVLLDKNDRGLEHLNRTQRSLPRSTQITERRSAKETKYVFGGDSPTPAGPNGRAPAARLLIDRARPSAENTEHRKCQTDPWGQSKGSHIPENQKSQDAASNEADLQPDSPQARIPCLLDFRTSYLPHLYLSMIHSNTDKYLFIYTSSRFKRSTIQAIQDRPESAQLSIPCSRHLMQIVGSPQKIFATFFHMLDMGSTSRSVADLP